MLRVTRRELTSMYRQHRACCGDLSAPSYKLIALYCIECGLKALIMKDRRIESYDDLSPEINIGHDLLAGLKLLRAPVVLFKIKNLRISTVHAKGPQQAVSLKELHQAVRYGIPTNLQAEIATEIANLLKWLEEQFNDGN